MKKVLFILLAVVVLLSGCGVQKQNTNSVNEPEGVVIALLDIGISLRAIDEKYILPGYNYTENSENTEDRINHGTAAASVIVGSAPAKVEGLAENVRLVPLVVLSKTEDGKQKSIDART
jgi:subtilisin family serine protease